MATKVMTLRLEGEVFQRVSQFQAQHGMTSPSEAIRALLELAIRDAQDLETTFRRAAWRAGVRNSALALREKMDRAVAECLGATDAEISAASKG